VNGTGAARSQAEAVAAKVLAAERGGPLFLFRGDIRMNSMGHSMVGYSTSSAS